MTRDIGYRPDIDGLRAIAVGSVVIFHLFKGVIGGGFLGVDVFFVISGYLITSIIARECERGDFSIRRFYVRRLRRIGPALVTLLIVTMVAATLLLMPSDLVGFGKSALATLGFVSNIYFWRDTNYFSPAADTKPLLHTWSLGIEEQFYIFFPLMLAFAWRSGRWGGRQTAFWMVVLVTIGSFAIDVATNIAGKASTGFYLLPMRGWELGLGAIVAFVGPARLKSAATANAIAALAFVLVLVLMIPSQPGIIAPLPTPLPAVVGTALLIWVGAQDNAVSRLLSLRLFVGVGLISYSLYLWHWPVNVLFRYWLIEEPAVWQQALLLLPILLLSWASWRFVEQPFRSRDIPVRRVVMIVGGGAAVVAVGALALILFAGLPGRVPAAAAAYNRIAGTNYRCPPTSLIAFGALYACPINLPGGQIDKAEVALVGDSHAQMYLPALEHELRKRGLGGVLVPVNGCLPTRDVNLDPGCAALMRGNLDAVRAAKNIRLVIIATYWQNMAKPLVDTRGMAVAGAPWPAIQRDLEGTIASLRASGKQVVVVGPLATPGYDFASVQSRAMAFGRSVSFPLEVSRAVFDRDMGAIRLWGLSGAGGAGFVDPSSRLCDAQRCGFVIDGQPVFADDGHISYLVADRFGPLFATALDAVN